MKAEKSHIPNELCLELKYCERCGGLWLRPVGGGQVYCVICGRVMADLPPPAKAPRYARAPQGPLCAPVPATSRAVRKTRGVALKVSGGAA